MRQATVNTMESLLISAPATEDAGIQSFLDTANLEFQASLQLLAQRAAFLTGATGAAVALKKAKSYLYFAAAGESTAEPGSEADLSEDPIRNCMEQRTAIRTTPTEAEDEFRLIVPIISNDELIGIFELNGNYEFQNENVDAVQRIADLVSVSIEHRNAAEKSSSRIAERDAEIKTALRPSSWHAPNFASEQAVRAVELDLEDSASTPKVQACTSCGFPVSPGRTLCVDCERKPDLHPSSSSDLFTLPNEESWFNSHGLTILGVLIPTIAAALYFWLRH